VPIRERELLRDGKEDFRDVRGPARFAIAAT
jgi:hypothetical protein